ncbi:DtxR family Mn-dependent transcriptional regulator [Arthrobacter pigmenti]|uniref:Manganese transport regulator n=1 Tax=Arthrobacter pigmenti TaxID=271432 RepID=A0A846RMP0_9MICC|nr:metal-dependent transcriptional regulator [Arthrobacter pigmenti]NJC22880.1 DtxR family Mn-dependent transcriptional regulator [Arthrobacter pigmenti]
MAPKASALGIDSTSVQDYVKTIYALSEWHDAPVTSSRLAARLAVANSSVSEMIRKLDDLGLVRHEPYRPVELTAGGRRLALAMVRRHRLLETFLVRELGYRWDEVHDEAELLEHTVSDTFIDRLDAKLGCPAADPHGDPIPTADGSITLPDALPLHRLDDGHFGRVARISDENPSLLRFLASEQIGIGSPVTVLQRKPFGGALQARVDIGHSARDLDLGDELTGAIWIESVGKHAGCSLVP